MTEMHDETTVAPVPVRVVNDEESIKAAEFGAWTTFQWVAGSEPPVQILPQTRKRRRAVLTNTSAGAATPMYVGTRAQCFAQLKNGAAGAIVAGIIQQNASVTVENQGELWAVALTALTQITVLDERDRE